MEVPEVLRGQTWAARRYRARQDIVAIAATTRRQVTRPGKALIVNICNFASHFSPGEIDRPLGAVLGLLTGRGDGCRSSGSTASFFDTAEQL